MTENVKGFIVCAEVITLIIAPYSLPAIFSFNIFLTIGVAVFDPDFIAECGKYYTQSMKTPTALPPVLSPEFIELISKLKQAHEVLPDTTTTWATNSTESTDLSSNSDTSDTSDTSEASEASNPFDSFSVNSDNIDDFLDVIFEYESTFGDKDSSSSSQKK